MHVVWGGATAESFNKLRRKLIRATHGELCEKEDSEVKDVKLRGSVPEYCHLSPSLLPVVISFYFGLKCHLSGKPSLTSPATW